MTVLLKKYYNNKIFSEVSTATNIARLFRLISSPRGQLSKRNPPRITNFYVYTVDKKFILLI